MDTSEDDFDDDNHHDQDGSFDESEEEAEVPILIKPARIPGDPYRDVEDEIEAAIYADIFGGAGENQSASRHLVDLEAEEQNGDDGYDVNKWNDGSDEEFHCFMNLPPEIRALIWTFFCPDLAYPATVLSYQYPDRDISHASSSELTLDVMSLHQITARRVLGAVHHESRQLLLHRFPDTLPISGDENDEQGEVRYNAGKDIVFFAYPLPYRDHQGIFQVEKPIWFTEPIQNAGFTFGDPSEGYQALYSDAEMPDAIELADAVLLSFPNVENIFIEVPLHDQPNMSSMGWTTKPEANRYISSFDEDGEAGLTYEIRRLWCWPKLIEYPTWAKRQVGTSPLLAGLYGNLEQKGVQVSSIVNWAGRDIEKWENKFYIDGLPIPDDQLELGFSDEEESDASVEVEDEYESDGIDDREIGDASDLSSDEADFTDVEDAPPGDEDNLLVGNNDIVRQSRPLKRQIVDSDDSDEDESQPQTKRAKIGSTILISDSEEEEAAPSPKKPKRRGTTRVIESDSEDENGEDEDNKAANAPESDGGGESDDSDESSSEEEELEEPEKPPRAQPKIRKVIRRKPFWEKKVAPEDEDEDEEDEEDADDGSIGNDDDLEDDDDEEDGEDNEEGLFDLGADETDNDDGDGSEDEEY